MTGGKKYYLGFTYSDEPTVGLHCTHCYFGTLNAAQVESVIHTVHGYFSSPIKMPTVVFDIPTIFGDEDRTRVLVTKDVEAFAPMRGLRDRFAERDLISRKYPFRPHVSTKQLGLVNQPFHDYALVGNGEVIKRWPIQGEGNSPTQTTSQESKND